MATQPNPSTLSDRQPESAAIHRGRHPRRKVGQAKAVHDVDRQTRAIELKLAGKTYREIGAELGITRQRAQQLIKPSFQTIRAVRNRAKDCCEICSAPIKGQEAHIHHVAQDADYNALSNLLYVCSSCHRLEHTTCHFNELPPGPIRREASEAFARPYLEHIEERFCMACGTTPAKYGLCKKCAAKRAAVNKAKGLLAHWLRNETNTSAHSLNQAIYEIRKNNLTPTDFGPPEVQP